MLKRLLRAALALCVVAVIFAGGYFTGERYALESISTRLLVLEARVSDLSDGVERAASAAEGAQATAEEARDNAAEAQSAAQEAQSSAEDTHSELINR